MLGPVEIGRIGRDAGAPLNVRQEPISYYDAMKSNAYTLFFPALAASGVLSGISLAVPEVPYYLLISIIGIPVALILALMPLLFLFMLTAGSAFAIIRMTGFRLVPARYAAAVTAIVALAALPFWANAKLENTSSRLLEGDHNSIGNPFNAKILAVVASSRVTRSNVCESLCQRLLLSGAVEGYLAVAAKPSSVALKDDLTGTLFRMEQREECPTVEIPASFENVIEGTSHTASRHLSDKAMRARIASGHCLVKERASLARADAIVVAGEVRSGIVAFDAGFDAFADTIQAHRVAYFERKEDAFRERFRETSVAMEKLTPILMPSFLMARYLPLKIDSGFIRYTVRRGETTWFTEQANIDHFLKDTMNLDLSVSADAHSDKTRQLIRNALDKSGEVDRATLDAIKDWLDGQWLRRSFTRRDADLALRVLTDRRVPVPYAAAAPIRKIETAAPDLIAPLATILFDRLNETDPHETLTIQRAGERPFTSRPFVSLSKAIGNLPDRAIPPFKVELERLARDPVARSPALKAIVRLSAIGEEAVPIFIDLVDEAERLGPHSDWYMPYMIALEGLCLMESEGQAAVPQIFQRWDSGAVPARRNPVIWDLEITTLVRLGADHEEVWKRVRSDDKNHSRRHFNAVVVRAKHDRSCSWSAY